MARPTVRGNAISSYRASRSRPRRLIVLQSRSGRQRRCGRDDRHRDLLRIQQRRERDPVGRRFPARNHHLRSHRQRQPLPGPRCRTTGSSPPAADPPATARDAAPAIWAIAPGRREVRAIGVRRSPRNRRSYCMCGPRVAGKARRRADGTPGALRVAVLARGDDFLQVEPMAIGRARSPAKGGRVAPVGGSKAPAPRAWRTSLDDRARPVESPFAVSVSATKSMVFMPSSSARGAW